ncbi:ABC bile acid [Mycena kentingensis (nom. inval.)]|nr:ABC bile acid [Mycena kentingensis (nom. inval.)]
MKETNGFTKLYATIDQFTYIEPGTRDTETEDSASGQWMCINGMVGKRVDVEIRPITEGRTTTTRQTAIGKTGYVELTAPVSPDTTDKPIEQSKVIITSVVFPPFILPGVLISAVYWWLANGYLQTARDLRRMESNSRSPIFSDFGELLAGMVTVRAFSAEKRFMDGFHLRVDAMAKMWYSFWMCNRWLLLNYDVLGGTAVYITALFAIIVLNDAGLAGLVITSALTFSENVYWTCRYWADLELNLKSDLALLQPASHLKAPICSSVERITEYLELPQEPPAIIESNRPPAYWPSSASNDALIAVEDLHIKLKAGERVGLVGRTGSGKSTLAMSFLRFVDPSNGKIVVDGIDISKIGLHDLRSRMTFIPQDAVLFSGTLRDNLDPFNAHEDSVCFDVLRRVHLIASSDVQSRVPTPGTSRAASVDYGDVSVDDSLSTAPTTIDTKTTLSLDTQVSAGGSNFSAGQRQLIALARALLRRSTIVIMDEATSSVDMATDAKIQHTIREEFARSLLITVAHRLKTIIDYDRVIVLDKGKIVEFDSPLELMRREGSVFKGMCMKRSMYSKTASIIRVIAQSIPERFNLSTGTNLETDANCARLQASPGRLRPAGWDLQDFTMAKSPELALLQICTSFVTLAPPLTIVAANMAFATAPALPDEIISEMISPVLRVPDEDFRNSFGYASPFARFSESTSAILVVCKAWLRVATPLLYHTVVIRSKGQAAALQTALRGNSQLGAFIRKLRIEGGFGEPMHEILRRARNITDLFVVVSVWPADRTAELCAGLALINPRRLIISDAQRAPPNMQHKALVRVLGECIASGWSNLKVVDLPYAFTTQNFDEPGKCKTLYGAIKKSKTIEEIFAPAANVVEAQPHLSFVAISRSLAECSQMKRIVLTNYMPLNDGILAQVVRNDPLLRDIVVLKLPQFFADIKFSTKRPAKPVDPLFVPLSLVSEDVRDKIWGRVLFFAMGNDLKEIQRAQDIDAFSSRRQQDCLILGSRAYAPLLRVCKLFEVLGRPHFYRYIQIYQSGDVDALLSSLKSDPRLASCVRSLSLSPAAASGELDPSNSDISVDAIILPAVNTLLAQLPNLILLHNGGARPNYPPGVSSPDSKPYISWEAFETIARVCAPSLEAFLAIRIAAAQSVQPPMIFGAFASLRSLEWSCMTEFRAQPAGAWPGELPALPNLECLALGHFHPSFLTVLAGAELPSLRRLYFLLDIPATAQIPCRRFLESHQSKLFELRATRGEGSRLNVLDFCPNLPLIIYGDGKPAVADHGSGLASRVKQPSYPATLKPTIPHLNLERILLNSRKYQVADLQQILSSVRWGLFPALRAVQMFLPVWPTNEHDIEQDELIPIVEALLDLNVSTMDRSGVVWRARLRCSE